MRTYRQLFAVAEFRALFAVRCLVIVSVSLSGLAIGAITYASTGSTVLTALAMFGGPLLTVVGSLTVLSASDSLTPRVAVTLPLVAAGLVDAVQAVPSLSWPVRFVLLAIPYLVNSAVSGATNRMLSLIVPDEAFLLGRASLNVAVGVTQVASYAAGGLLLAVLSPSGVFLVAASAAAVGTAVARLGLADRPALQTHRRLLHRTRSVNRALLGSGTLRPVYLAFWVPNGLIVGCEALFLPLAGSSAAGYLFAVTAAGMLLGDVVIGRFTAEAVRDRLLTPLRLLLALPYLAMFADPPMRVVVVVGFVAAVGYAAGLPLQGRVHRLADPAVRGQAFGLAGSGLMVGQALGALLGGGLAEVLPVHTSMGLLAAASVLVSLALSRGLRRSGLAVPAPAG